MEKEHEIISRLKFIGKIKKNEKINTKHMFPQPVGILTTISRSIWYKDNRDNTYSYISETIDEALNLLEKYQTQGSSSCLISIENLLRDFENAKTGMNNLKSTYLEDTKFSSTMDTLIQHVDTKLKTYKLNTNIESKPSYISIEPQAYINEKPIQQPVISKSYESTVGTIKNHKEKIIKEKFL